MLADISSSSTDFLNPPSAPFARTGSSGGLNLNMNHGLSSGRDSGTGSAAGSNLSLSVNYLPSKFSSALMTPGGGARFRNKARGSKGDGGDAAGLPKRGGGLEAFKSGESRMPQGRSRLRWNKFKWWLFFANTLLTLWSLVALIIALTTWFDVWENSDVVRAGNHPELVLSTLAACIGLFTSVIGWSGILLNNRSFLAWYTFLTWITFAFLVVPGYITYKKRTFNLEGKINAQWSQALKSSGRLRIQNQLKCCGYFSPFIEATVSQTCYSRSVLPGCKLPYLQYERRVLGWWYKAVFITVPVQIFIMVTGLLCSGHITYRFGKGMMPEAYRLNLSTMAVIMDNYANQLAEQYGSDVAQEILKRSQSNLQLSDSGASYGGSTPALGTFNQGGGGGAGNKPTHAPMAPFHAKYTSIGKGEQI
ncbi:hypothetical protein BJ165DRAFT_1521583 [Panaeolus papilionaceus]|nr:hypothetical protein BJ165DRAFT_1521583 [Panaeolus papilionaceus]